MSPGPLRRMLGALGLAALAPVALRLVDGSMSATDAALRAVATLVAVVVVGRLAGTWLDQVAHTYDRQGRRARGLEPVSGTPTRSTDPDGA